MAETLPEPRSRKEQYLAKAAGMDTPIPARPESRLELYLNAIVEGGGGGGGGGTTGEARNLSDSDFNWNSTSGSATEPFDSVALWLLEPGMYYTTNDINVYLDSGYTDDGTDYPSEALGDSQVAIVSMVDDVGILGKYQSIMVIDGARSLYYPVYTLDPDTGKRSYLTQIKFGDFEAMINGRVKQNAGTPSSTTTMGTVGQLLEDTTNGKLYICTAVTLGEEPGDPDTYTWTEVGGGGSITPVQTTGTSTTDVMSQNATTSMVFADPLTTEKVRIGNTSTLGAASIAVGSNSSAYGNQATAVGVRAYADAQYSVSIGGHAGEDQGTRTYSTNIGYNAKTTADGAVAIGSNSSATRVGEMNIGLPNASTAVASSSGYNGTKYRLLSGVYDGQSAHDAATKGQLDSIAIQNAGAPTTATVGTVGQLLEDTTNGKLYQCTAVDTTDPQNPSYTWSEVGGGSGPTVVQTAGNSQTDVMSQNAVTSMIYEDPNSRWRIRIGNTNTLSNGGISIGPWASGGNQANTVSLGNYAVATNGESIAIGSSTKCSNAESVALGAGATTTRNGELNIGTGSLTTAGFNSSNYRVIGGVYDGQDLHDAATVAQGNTLATSAPTTTTVGVLGQLYTDTTGMHTYQLTAIDTTDPSNPSYTWTQRW